MHRTNANKSIREAQKGWTTLRDEMLSGRLFDIDNGPTHPLLDGDSASSHRGSHAGAGDRASEGSFFERNFNMGTGCGLQSFRGREARLSIGGGGSSGGGKTSKWWNPQSDAMAIWSLLLSSYMNVLLCLAPLGVASWYFDWGPVATFTLNFAAIIPLALILGDVTEDLALRCGEVVGGLVNATFGNVVELILSVVALSKKTKVQNQVASMSNTGSILSNLLLVLGCCFFFGGLTQHIQTFNHLANQVCNSLLFLAIIALVLPDAAKLFPDMAKAFSPASLLLFSRIIAIVMLVTYLIYLYFQLISHHDLFAATKGEGEDEEEEEQASLTITAEILLLAGISIIVATASEFITGSIEDMSKTSGLSTNFLSVILLPLAGNAVEHITAVMCAMRNKMDLALGICLGSSLQIALFVVPVCVLWSWAIGNDFSLDFNSLGVVSLVLAVIHANFITAGGKSHWLMGVQLIATYILIGTTFLFC